MSINEMFFELIRVAIGTQNTLFRPPSKGEWAELYAMAKKQSLVGICFSAVQKLTQNPEPNSGYGLSVMDSGLKRSDQEPIAPNPEPRTQNLDEVLYLTWMGMAAKILQRNEVVNRQCVELQAKLSTDGFKSSILKGQGVASLYSEHLRGLRQSGDIDVWVLPNEGETEKEHIERVVKYAKGFDPESHFSGKHIDLSVFADTEVELHVTPAKMSCPWHERRLKAWFQEESFIGFQEVSSFDSAQEPGFRVPTTEFNLVYLLLHCYDHLLFEGVGLRQVMDYHMVLRTVSDGFRVSEFQEVLKSLGLMKFASAMLWVIDYVFGDLKLSETMKLFETMGIKPNEKEGRFLLNEIMTGGNFGKYGNDGVMEGHAKGKVAFVFASMKHKMRFLTHYPSEVLWAPYAMLRYYIRK